MKASFAVGHGQRVHRAIAGRLLGGLIGNFKNNGRGWRRKAKPVNDNDFRTDAIGVALPYGIYYERRNTGMVIVGTTTRLTPCQSALL